MTTDRLSPEFQEALSQDPVKRYAIQILANNLDEQQWKQLPADLVPAIVDAMLQFNAVSFNASCTGCVDKDEEPINSKLCKTCTPIVIDSHKSFFTNFEQK